MARKPRWEELGVSDGIGDVRLFSWRYFADYINQEMLDFREYIWRGQRYDNWLLESTLDRRTRGMTRLKRRRVRNTHLQNFKFGVRGRRGPNPSDLTENDWWALGQHHGLDTPLLDWTSSPFAAAYFAFYGQGTPQTSRRAIYALHASSVQAKSEELSAAHEKKEGIGRAPIVELVRPLSDKGSSLLLTHNATSPIEPSLARRLRIEYPGACYHMMNRGGRSDLFLDNSDCQRVLEIGVRQTL